MRSTLRKGAVTVVGASAILSLALGTIAQADPNLRNTGAGLPASQGGFLPDANDLVGVGSDTTQFVINSAAQAYSFTSGAFRPVRLASYDAINPTTKQRGDNIALVDPDQHLNASGVPALNGDETVIPRPDGSSAGINALLNTTAPYPTLDFARSSRFRDATKPLEQNLYFIPALKDGLSYVVDKSATADIRNLDATELSAIYRCTDTRGFAPKLPQAGSGTRSYFLAQIGVTEAQIGTCVDQNVQEHDASAVAGNPVALAPFSTARYGNNPANPASPPSNTVDIAATTATAGVFYAERTVYNVVRKADYDAVGSPLPAIFGPGGYLCTRFNSGLNRQGFGVADISGQTCGSLL